jgi:hypothetical protein
MQLNIICDEHPLRLEGAALEADAGKSRRFS